MRDSKKILNFIIQLVIVFFAIGVQGQILVSGTDFDPSSGNASRYYIGLSDITQIGLQPGTITSTPPLAPNVNPNIFNAGYFYAVTPTPIRLDSARYQDFTPTTDYSYVYAPTATSPGANVNILSYSLTGLVPNSAVSVIVDYCSAVKSTYAACTGQRNQFKAGINLDQYNQLNGNDVNQIGMGQCQSNYTITGTADASGNMVFRMNDTQFGSCQAMAIKKIQIMGTPLPQIFAAQGSEVCAGEQITLQSKLAYNATYQWQVNSGSGWTNIAGGTNAAQLYEVTNVQAYQFRLQITPLTGGAAITSSAISVNAITCCQVNGVAASRQTIYYDNFGRIDLTDKTGKSYFVWDYSNVLNPVEVAKTTTTPFRWPLVPAPLGATFQGGPGPLNDGDYCVAGYLTGYNPDNGYAGAMLQWANRVTGLANPPDLEYDHSGQVDGACLFINCPPNTQGQSIYTRNITNLCFGKQLYFETWIAVFTNSAGGTYSGVDVTLRLTDGGNAANVVTANGTATRQADGGGIWVRIAGNINLVGTSLKMEIINNSTVSANGNDLVIDDIKIMACAPPTIGLFFDLPTLSEAIDVCTTPISLQTKASALLKTYYGNATLYLYQWTRTPSDNTSWTNYGTPMSAETYAISNPQADPAFATLINGGKVYFRVVAGTALIFSTNNNFTAPTYANKNDPCKNYSVSDPTIVANVNCPSCTKPTTVAITAPASTPLSICQGTAQTLSGTATVAAASINGGFTYSWRKTAPSLTVLNTPTATALTIGTATAVPSNTTAITGLVGDAGTYVLRVEDGNTGNSSCYTEATVVVTVNPTLVPSVAIAVSPTGAICAGASVTFTATPTNGGAGPTYQWKKGGTAIAGATNATYTTATAANGDSYTVTLTSNALCASPTTATSSAIVMTVNPVLVPSVVIAVSPTGAICAGTSVTFTATPTNGGAGPTYQWKKGGTAIAGATNATYTTTTAANGDSYTVTLTSNALCASPTTATSTAIVMTVNPVLVPSVAIAVSPTGAICAGTSLTFTATPTNGGTPTYQWKKGGTAIAGETNATYTTTTAANADSYTVTMTSNALCASPLTATSTAIVITVNPILVPSVAIAVSPTGAICAGASVTFTATPTNGGAGPTYQWKKGGTAIAGATNATYITTTAANADSYTVTMTSNALCTSTPTATSTAIVMTVNPILPVSVTISTPSTTICAGTSVTFTAAPTNGGAAPTYQWKKGGTAIAGATNSTYTTTTAANGDSYTVVMTSNASCPSGNPATSNAVVITVTTVVTAGVSITAAPAGAICAGTSVTFTAVPGNGGAGPTYQWKKGGTAIAGATNVTFTSGTLVNGDQISVDMVSNSGCVLAPGTATSNVITMVVNPNLTPTVATVVSPTGAICAGASLTFTATPTNGGTSPAYQWKNGATTIVGATNATYTTTTASNGDSYTVTLTSNALCASPTTATSTAIVITVNPILIPSVTISASPTTICTNGSSTFTAVPTNPGAGPLYEWFVKGVSQGAPAASATFSTTLLTLSTDVVKVTLTSNATCVSPATASASMSVTVNAGIGSGTIGTDQTICYNTSPSVLTETVAPTSIVGAPTYKWESSPTGVAGSFVTIPGATSQTYTPVALTQDAYIRRVITDPGTPSPCNVATSNTIHITVQPQLVAGVIAGDETVCSGLVPATMTQTTAPTGGTGSYTYQWQSDASGLMANIVGATNSSYASVALTATTKFQLIETSGTCGNVTSNVVTKTVTPIPTITPSITSNVTSICSGKPVAFTASVSGTGSTPAPTYEWFVTTATTATGGVSQGTPSTTATSFGTSALTSTSNTVYVQVVSNATCASTTPVASSVITITVNAGIGSGTIGSDQTICYNTTPSVLTETVAPTSIVGAPTYTWESSPTGVLGSFTTISGATNQTYTPTVSIQDVYIHRIITDPGTPSPCNVATSNTIHITVNPVLVVGAISADETLCSGSVPATMTQTVAPTGGTGSYTYQWQSDASGSMTNIPGATNSSYTSLAITATTKFQLVETSGTCGSVTTNVVTKTVSAKENVTASLPDPGPLCASTTATIFTGVGTTDGSGTLSYAWTLNGTAVGTNSTTYSYIPIAADNGKVVKVVVSTSNACNSGNNKAASFILNIINAVAPSVSISTPFNPTCVGYPANFTAVAKDTGATPTYQWYVIPAGSAIGSAGNAVGPNLNKYTSFTLSTGDSVYVTVKSSLTCALAPNPASSKKIGMTVFPVPMPSILETDTSICAPGSVLFHAVITSGNTVKWYYNNSVITGATGLTYKASNAGSYSIEESNPGCNNTSTVKKLTLIAPPIANAGADQTLVQGTPSGLVGSGGSIYNWSPATYLSNDSISNPIFKAQATITYKLTVTDATGKCKSTSDVTIYVIKPIIVPNVITVNGDGVNDTWEIENIHGYPNAIIEIYNRWGNLVWKTEGYLKNWDGSNFRNGEVLPDGTYFYIINLQSQVYTEPYTGWVQIIK